MDIIVPILIALVAIAVAWKLFAGLVKTIALVVIAGVAAIYIFGMGA